MSDSPAPQLRDAKPVQREAAWIPGAAVAVTATLLLGALYLWSVRGTAVLFDLGQGVQALFCF